MCCSYIYHDASLILSLSLGGVIRCQQCIRRTAVDLTHIQGNEKPTDHVICRTCQRNLDDLLIIKAHFLQFAETVISNGNIFCHGITVSKNGPLLVIQRSLVRRIQLPDDRQLFVREIPTSTQDWRMVIPLKPGTIDYGGSTDSNLAEIIR